MGGTVWCLIGSAPQYVSMQDRGFEKLFLQLTGNPPLNWQRRLYEQWLAGDVKAVIDLPTGMGKTMVMAIWLIAQPENPKLGRRLIYVVDRRTVVDQATDLATAFQEKLGKNKLTISTLRGQFADNREWARNPSQPAIIIGTVDMIGSRLLFSGYRSSYKLRPLDTGLLGQDALLILDEAHLSSPFAKLTRAIEEMNRTSCLPFRVIHMSATSAAGCAARFTLETSDLTGARDTNPIVRRFGAKKWLTVHEGVTDANDEIAKKAAELTKDNSRVVVFVRSPDSATRLAKNLRKRINNKNEPDHVEILTGTMRGLERDELVEEPIMRRFLAPANRPDEGPAVLVSTSAGEVGFDLNADHLVCDAVPLDSMIQRLGRVNRRGDGEAQVHVLVQKEKEAKDDKKKSPFEAASAEAVKALKQLPRLEGETYDASPKAFASLDKPDGALSPKPATVDLTDILLDAWSMTTIVEPMPGRPPVAPWLRGIDEDLPETTIAWRAELDIPGFEHLEIDGLEEWYDAHPVLTHETLSVRTNKAAEWLLERWDKLGGELQEKIAERPCIIDRGGLLAVHLKALIDQVNARNMNLIRNADLILAASFGGIERGEGLVNADAPASRDPKAPDVADVRGRYREIKTVNGEGTSMEPSVGPAIDDSNRGKCARYTVDLSADGETQRRLISYVPKSRRIEMGTDRQPLAKHVRLVETHAAAMGDRLGLNGYAKQALALAAKWHDNGKNRKIWQDAVKRNASEPPVGKSGGFMRPLPGGYRHEFGSLREFADAHKGRIDAEVFDLAMHLIAAHHGRGRPHFPKGGFDPDAPRQSLPIATDAIRRFARLQRKYGYWYLAWLENLLRCADAMASSEGDAEGK